MSNSQRAGIHRVQGATVEYVGQGVRKYNNLTITSAVVVSDVSQVRFYTIDGTTLVFSWTTNTWTTNTDQPCHSAIAGYAGCAGVVYANSDTLQILAEDPESTTEGNVSFTHHLQSPWLAIADMEGWERILRISGVGRPVGPHTLQVKLYRDNDPTDQVGTLTKQFEVTDSKWAWNIKPSVQKLTSLMIDMEVLPNLTYAIAPDAGDAYATVDGDGTWTIPNFTFSSAMVGGTLTIAGSIGAEFDGVFTIASVPSAHVLVMTPPIDTRTTTPPMFAANTGTITLDYVAPTNGPQIAGVSLEVRIKTGLKKQPKSARLTPT
jgi:hypothetical protein